MVEINIAWYMVKVKAQAKALKVARNPYSFENSVRVMLLRMVRDELRDIANKMDKDIKTFDADEREQWADEREQWKHEENGNG